MSFEIRYSRLERALHRLAFNTKPAQIAVADIEEQLFKKLLAPIVVRQPVFITALPRAGTTLLLELFVSQNEFVSHSYRHMPFVLTPMLWQRYSSRFQRTGNTMERAHGDGMLINEDSPEALEEIVWRSFWGKHYQADCIRPWETRRDPEFDDFLPKHMRKIIALQSQAAGCRYISKNNLNIARLDLLKQIFADATIIVPFRQPLQHAASMLRQHLNFIQIHQQDAFARDYMAAIGHFDFGANLRPVDFDGWLATAQYRDPAELGFWLEYWVASYRHILGKAVGPVCLLGYEALCADPVRGLAEIADYTGIRNKATFVAQAGRLKQGPEHGVNVDGIDAGLLESAAALYRELSKASLVA